MKHELLCPPSYAVGSNKFSCSRLVNSLLFPSCKKVPQEARSTEGSKEEAQRGVEESITVKAKQKSNMKNTMGARRGGTWEPEIGGS